MKVLGLGTEGDSGASLVEDGRLVAALNEERTSRLKLVSGFPRESIRLTTRWLASYTRLSSRSVSPAARTR